MCFRGDVGVYCLDIVGFDLCVVVAFAFACVVVLLC